MGVLEVIVGRCGCFRGGCGSVWGRVGGRGSGCARDGSAGGPRRGIGRGRA